MFENVKAVIFDLDGTLVDSIGMWNDVDRELITNFGGKPRENVGGERDTFLATNTSGNIYMEYAKYLRDSYNLNTIVEEVSNLRDKLSGVYLRKSIDLKPKAEIVLKELKARCFIQVLATIGSRWVLDIYTNENENIKSKVDFNDIFGSKILTKENVKNKKPDPEIYFKSVEIAGVEKHECLVIEDSLSGVQAAKRAGLKVAAIYDRYSNDDRESINLLSDYQLDDYEHFLYEINKNQKVLKR